MQMTFNKLHVLAIWSLMLVHVHTCGFILADASVLMNMTVTVFSFLL